MKKVLSFVLSIAMVVCLMPTMAFAATTSASQAAAAYSDTEGTACEGAVNVLTALKVVDGFTDGTYKPEQTVTRAQMAKLIVTALGVADYATAKTSKFVDMGAATWSIPYVEYAANLNIVNGVGNGKFNPNGLVTYEQAATMIVRALGYTDQCKEMNGTWPAIYVQKAMALGVFEDVANGGANGATRGDIAIMLYNAIELAEVYADADGTTHYKTGNNATYFNGVAVNGVTMLGTLNKNGSQAYEVISSQDADTALTDVRPYVGAAAKVTKDKNGDILAVGDLKTTFLTGDVSSDGKKITVDDVDYEISNADFVGVKASTGGADKDVKADKIENGATTSAAIDAAAFKTSYWGVDDVTIAAKVSGKTVKEIYSVATWTVKKASKVSDSDLTNVIKNCKLLSKSFDKNDNLEPDTTSFVLNGVASLSDIKADNVVYVYTNTSDKIRRVDVGTTVIKGEITKKTASKITIDGKSYKFAKTNTGELASAPVDIDTWDAGDEVTVYLDYNGKIYDGELVESNSGNYALLYSKSTTPPNSDDLASDSKVKLVVNDGSVKIFNINGEKYNNNVKDNKSSKWADLTQGSIVKYEVNSEGKITKLYKAGATGVNSNKNSDVVITNNYISKSAMLQSIKISDGAVIFTLPATKDVSGNYSFSFKDSDDAGIAKLDSVLDSTPELVTAIKNDKDKIVAMLISDEATSDDFYGIVTSSYNLKDSDYGADFYIGTEKKTDTQTDEKYAISKTDAKDVTLYKIQNTTGGKYKMTDAASTLVGIAKSATNDSLVKFDNGYIKADAATIKNAKDETVSSLSLYDSAVVYIYDDSADEWTIGSKSDLTDEDNYTIKFYSTSTDKKDAQFGLVDYVVIYRA